MKTKARLSKLLVKDYETLIKEAAVLNGMVYHYEHIHNQYIVWVKSLKINKSIPKNYNDLILGSKFTYRSPHNGKLIFGGEDYIVNTKNVEKKSELLKRKTNNYIVSNVYETFEKFLRTITSRIVVKNLNASIQYDERLGFSSFKSCYIFLNSQYRDNLELIRLLRAIIPELDAAFKKNKKLSLYLDFYRTLIRCRNHIIHSNDYIDTNIIQRLGHIEKKYLEQYFGVIINLKLKKQLINTTGKSKEIIKIIIELGYLIITSIDTFYINEN